MESMRIFAGMEFDDRRAKPESRIKLTLACFDKQRNANTGIGQPANNRRELVVKSCRIKPALCCAFFALFRHDAGGVRFVAQRDLQHFLSRGHFQIERQIGCGLDTGKVLIADMATIFAKVPPTRL